MLVSDFAYKYGIESRICHEASYMTPTRKGDIRIKEVPEEELRIAVQDYLEEKIRKHQKHIEKYQELKDRLKQ